MRIGLFRASIAAMRRRRLGNKWTRNILTRSCGQIWSFRQGNLRRGKAGVPMAVRHGLFHQPLGLGRRIGLVRGWRSTVSLTICLAHRLSFVLEPKVPVTTARRRIERRARTKFVRFEQTYLKLWRVRVAPLSMERRCERRFH